LRAHPVRTALALVSVAAGVGAVTTMSSLARSGVVELTRTFEEVGGATMVGVFPQPPTRSARTASTYTRGITVEDGLALRARVALATRVEMHAVVGRRDVQVQERPPTRTDLVGANQDFLDTFRMSLARGRPLLPADVTGHARVAWLGATLCRRLFPGADGLGKSVRVAGQAFTVVGVVSEVPRFGVEFGFDWNDFLLVPLTAVPVAPQVILIGTGARRDNAAVAGLAGRMMLARHLGVDDFRVFDFAVVEKSFVALTRGTEVLAALIAGVALVAGCAGIMNLLLVSLDQQIVEIGTRRALGASNGAIAAQFAAEGGILGAIGAVVGVTGGWAVLHLAGLWIRRLDPLWITRFAGGVCATAAITSVLASMASGLVPARRAARRSVVDCLRRAV
jgi:putative ABC transport system permease protein